MIVYFDRFPGQDMLIPLLDAVNRDELQAVVAHDEAALKAFRAHDVVGSPDAAFSEWDSTLERNERGDLCLRLGLR